MSHWFREGASNQTYTDTHTGGALCVPSLVRVLYSSTIVISDGNGKASLIRDTFKTFTWQIFSLRSITFLFFFKERVGLRNKTIFSPGHQRIDHFVWNEFCWRHQGRPVDRQSTASAQHRPSMTPSWSARRHPCKCNKTSCWKHVQAKQWGSTNILPKTRREVGGGLLKSYATHQKEGVAH